MIIHTNGLVGGFFFPTQVKKKMILQEMIIHICRSTSDFLKFTQVRIYIYRTLGSHTNEFFDSHMRRRKMILHIWVQMTYNKPMCLFFIQDYYPFWGPFPQKNAFLKRNFQMKCFKKIYILYLQLSQYVICFFTIKFEDIRAFESAQILLDFVFCLEKLS